MFSKGLNDVQASINMQYVILKQMIDDISQKYQNDLSDFIIISKGIAKNEAGGDSDIFNSILQRFSDDEDMQNNLNNEARKILFCSIFSYYESTLNLLVLYYNIPINGTQIKQKYERIQMEYNRRSAKDLAIDNVSFINDFCRLLRNLYMHGYLDRKEDRDKLKSLAVSVCGVKYYASDNILIIDNTFLSDVLSLVKNVLTKIEVEFGMLR